MADNRPIGIFDSGVGGLTLVKSLMETLPDERFIYFGDTAHVPYGNKTEAQLFQYAHKIIAFLLGKKVKAIVAACGTHSSITLPRLKEMYPLPIMGVVLPGAIAAARVTRKGNIGVLATQATVNSLAYSHCLHDINPGFKVIEVACPRFVPLIENGDLTGTEIRGAVEEYLATIIEHQVDTLILGCTHYPFLAPLIKEYAGCEIQLVDPAYETVAELKELLQQMDLCYQDNHEHINLGCREFFVSGNDASFYNVGKNLVGDILGEVKKARWVEE